jgi:hypothetical protein
MSDERIEKKSQVHLNFSSVNEPALLFLFGHTLPGLAAFADLTSASVIQIKFGISLKYS